MTELKVDIRITRYEVTALPDDIAQNRSGLVISVEWRGKDKWAVCRDGYCWNHVVREWTYESIPSERTDEWLAQHRYDLMTTALQAAQVLAPWLTVNGWSVEQAVRMERGEDLCGEPVTRGVRCDLLTDHEGDHRP